MRLLYIALLFSAGLTAQTFDFSCDSDPHGFQPYVTDFLEIIEKRKITLSSTEGTITGVTSQTWGGAAYGVCNPGYNIEINLDLWNTWDDDLKRRVIYHELGHALLHLDHVFIVEEDISEDFVCPDGGTPWVPYIMFTWAEDVNTDTDCVPHDYYDRWGFLVDQMFSEKHPTFDHCMGLKGDGGVIYD